MSEKNKEELEQQKKQKKRGRGLPFVSRKDTDDKTDKQTDSVKTEPSMEPPSSVPPAAEADSSSTNENINQENKGRQAEVSTDGAEADQNVDNSPPTSEAPETDKEPVTESGDKKKSKKSQGKKEKKAKEKVKKSKDKSTKAQNKKGTPDKGEKAENIFVASLKRNLKEIGYLFKADKGDGQKAGFRVTVAMKLFSIIFVCIVGSVAITGYIAANVTNNIIRDTSENTAHETIRQTSEKIDAVLSGFEQVIMQIASNNEIHRNLYRAADKDVLAAHEEYLIALAEAEARAQEEAEAEAEETDEAADEAAADEVTDEEALEEEEEEELVDELTQIKERMRTLLAEVAMSNPSIINIAVIPLNPELNFYTSAVIPNVNYDRNAEWFQNIVNQGLNKNIWLHTEIGGFSNYQDRPMFALTRMVRSNYANTQQDFVILVEIGQALLNNQVYGVQLSDSSKVYVTNADNLLLHSTEAGRILTVADLGVPSGDRGVIKGADGQDYVVVRHQSPKAGWYVVGAAPLAELTKDTEIIGRAVIVITIVAMMIGIVLSILVARSIGGPLRRLQMLMKEGATGNLNVRTRFKNRDEIGMVGESFNEMMEQIKTLVQQTNNSAADVLNTAQLLSNSANETALAAREISEATEQIANGASTLASEAERGNELVLDVNNQISQVVEANRVMGEVATDVFRASEQGTNYMMLLTDKTQQTEEMTRRMVEKVDELKESTDSIRNVLNMLIQITQQTNILALNASIEASRSGAAGRGFMVIAGEIRKLADQSRDSIKVAADITEHIQTSIMETVTVMSEAYPMFQEQIASVKDAEGLFTNVRDRMTGLVQQADKVTESIEQLEKAQQVLSDTMSNVSAVSEESSAISEEVASSSASQLATSETLVQLVERLESLSNSLSEELKKFKI